MPGAVVTEHWRRRGCCTHRLISGRLSWKPISPMSGSRRSTLHRWLGVGRGRTHVLVHTCSLKDMYVCTHTHMHAHTRMRTMLLYTCMHACAPSMQEKSLHSQILTLCFFEGEKLCQWRNVKKKRKKVQFTLKVLGLLQLHCDSS